MGTYEGTLVVCVLCYQQGDHNGWGRFIIILAALIHLSVVVAMLGMGVWVHRRIKALRSQRGSPLRYQPFTHPLDYCRDFLEQLGKKQKLRSGASLTISPAADSADALASSHSSSQVSLMQRMSALRDGRMTAAARYGPAETAHEELLMHVSLPETLPQSGYAKSLRPP